MKKSLILFMLMIGLAKAQIVNIPDVNFKAYLLSNPEINTDYDSQIQVSEAAAFTGTIDVYNLGINDMTGIEFFVNLTTLKCGWNNISNLDVSKNSKLKALYCFLNQLTTLDVSKNLQLSILWCAGNKLTNLDISKNIELESLYCEGNQFSSLDLSENISLNSLSCGRNQFITLDLSKNTNLTWLYCNTNPLLTSLNLKNGNNTKLGSIYIVENPNLICVQVDDVNYANSQPSHLWTKDAIASYSTNCILSATETEKKQIRLYPNPAKDFINFSDEVSNIKITDLSGKVIKQIPNSEKSINVSKLMKGTYIITAVSKSGELITKKFIKE
ncbi:T9SS type A sorting domain-containing protein [Epilithonimonas mollis]|uniref:Por secretion system C-terminal sorting domain-containing protein n=1 Tax=Epilithonimonas mollis TaxID=216903 RepID=A0A1M6PPH6_9FLAO|nr:T9SS type A sorting domain-containing protein [Epilithonimonas mollis]SHK09866.1 Por secretion system C-terminal sorting domain-containing protein [Epilithonimonas mollis]